tara:strand:+ start:3765 stop:7550 length:3786 start_codon:yes stop_codon:yes gene_type:complete
MIHKKFGPNDEVKINLINPSDSAVLKFQGLPTGFVFTSRAQSYVKIGSDQALELKGKPNSGKFQVCETKNGHWVKLLPQDKLNTILLTMLPKQPEGPHTPNRRRINTADAPHIFSHNKANIELLRQEAEILQYLKRPDNTFINDDKSPLLILKNLGNPLPNYLSNLKNSGDKLTLARKTITELMILHRKGVAHRDVKHDNIVVAKDGKLSYIDFDAAELLKDTSKAGALVGTPGYLPQGFSTTSGDPTQIDKLNEKRISADFIALSKVIKGTQKPAETKIEGTQKPDETKIEGILGNDDLEPSLKEFLNINNLEKDDEAKKRFSQTLCEILLIEHGIPETDRTVARKNHQLFTDAYLSLYESSSDEELKAYTKKILDNLPAFFENYPVLKKFELVHPVPLNFSLEYPEQFKAIKSRLTDTGLIDPKYLKYAHEHPEEFTRQYARHILSMDDYESLDLKESLPTPAGYDQVTPTKKAALQSYFTDPIRRIAFATHQTSGFTTIDQLKKTLTLCCPLDESDFDTSNSQDPTNPQVRPGLTTPLLSAANIACEALQLNVNGDIKAAQLSLFKAALVLYDAAPGKASGEINTALNTIQNANSRSPPLTPTQMAIKYEEQARELNKQAYLTKNLKTKALIATHQWAPNPVTLQDKDTDTDARTATNKKLVSVPLTASMATPRRIAAIIYTIEQELKFKNAAINSEVVIQKFESFLEGLHSPDVKSYKDMVTAGIHDYYGDQDQEQNNYQEITREYTDFESRFAKHQRKYETNASIFSYPLAAIYSGAPVSNRMAADALNGIEKLVTVLPNHRYIEDSSTDHRMHLCAAPTQAGNASHAKTVISPLKQAGKPLFVFDVTTDHKAALIQNIDATANRDAKVNSKKNLAGLEEGGIYTVQMPYYPRWNYHRLSAALTVVTPIVLWATGSSYNYDRYDTSAALDQYIKACETAKVTPPSHNSPLYKLCHAQGYLWYSSGETVRKNFFGEHAYKNMDNPDKNIHIWAKGAIIAHAMQKGDTLIHCASGKDRTRDQMAVAQAIHDYVNKYKIDLDKNGLEIKDNTRLNYLLQRREYYLTEADIQPTSPGSSRPMIGAELQSSHSSYDLFKTYTTKQRIDFTDPKNTGVRKELDKAGQKNGPEECLTNKGTLNTIYKDITVIALYDQLDRLLRESDDHVTSTLKNIRSTEYDDPRAIRIERAQKAYIKAFDAMDAKGQKELSPQHQKLYDLAKAHQGTGLSREWTKHHPKTSTVFRDQQSGSEAGNSQAEPEQ